MGFFNLLLIFKVTKSMGSVEITYFLVLQDCEMDKEMLIVSDSNIIL